MHLENHVSSSYDWEVTIKKSKDTNMTRPVGMATGMGVIPQDEDL